MSTKNGGDERARYASLVQQITSDIGFNDMTIDELAELAALLIPAHRRFLAEKRLTVAGSQARRLHVVSKTLNKEA